MIFSPTRITLLLCGLVSCLSKTWLERVYGGGLAKEAIFIFGKINGYSQLPHTRLLHPDNFYTKHKGE